ncbi:type IV secretion system protein [Lysobacter sp. K5869]|uniref:type IV secretion system protein n=1 Tax=Lysobacter sp. K5869 TaxID=2820808 RepID=UPI001C0608BE|nr:type IV secretion system protein [Lysobacter sp. K5869]QWP76226.1 type IV secretion system protein [Lysobacter sp. K5869]
MSELCVAACSLFDLLDGLSAQFESLGQWIFFKTIFDHLDHEILVFRENMMHRMTSVIGAVAATLATMWIVAQGYRIMTGQSREPLMGLVVGSLRAFLIVTAAGSATFVSGNIYTTLGHDLPRSIAVVVTGRDEDPAETIDDGLTKMQLAMAAIDALPALDNAAIKEDKDRALLMTGIGVAGPAVMGGALLMMYKFAVALFIGLSPLFILSLLFERTKPMFGRWLQYGIGTMFSMAVLSFTVTVAMKMVAAVAANFAAQYLTMMALGAGDSPGVNTMALQQGGLGIFLTVLILSVPPMASSFFQGALGNFTPQSIFGANAAANSSSQSGTSPPPIPGTQSSGTPASNGPRGAQPPMSSDTSTRYKPDNVLPNSHANGSARNTILPQDAIKKAHETEGSANTSPSNQKSDVPSSQSHHVSPYPTDTTPNPTGKGRS